MKSHLLRVAAISWCLGSWGQGPLSAQLANSPPTPQWIEAASSSGEQGGELTRSFDWSGKLLKAILLCAAESKVEVIVNGKPAGAVQGRENATGVDLTQLVRQGGNTLTLRSARPVAALLEINGDLANKQWVATDGSWVDAAGAKAALRGPVDADPDSNPFDLKKTFDAYNSWQLAKRDNQNQATDPSTFTLPPGFKAELVRSAQPDEDSWVSMTFDPEGRITLGREKLGLLRLTLSGSGDQKVEVIDDTLKECRGLLYAHGALYANANSSKGLYRLRDTDGDGVFEEKQELLHSEGGTGHGRNHIKLGPDGRIYIVHGNNVLLPDNVSPSSPLRNYANDQVMPNPWDGSMFDGNVELPAGHILRMNPDGSDVQLIAGGLRNPLDIAFNQGGELFTFDADMERDVGTPWYMPTRVLQVLPGADFGWRRGTGRFPAWYADTLPSVVDIGLASPTAVFFGYGAAFPQEYQHALFIFDWSYGRIIAVHLTQKDDQFSGTQETFVSGRPLNVTDGCIGPDRALWFITGGRGTQSGLYRVSYSGPADTSTQPVIRTGPTSIWYLLHNGDPMKNKSEQAYDNWHDASFSPNLEIAWHHLASASAVHRHAARLALEASPTDQWGQRALKENDSDTALTALLALARVGSKDARDEIIKRLLTHWRRELRPEQRLFALRVLSVAIARRGGLASPQWMEWRALLEAAYPAREEEQRQRLNQELCRLLVRLESPVVIDKTLPLISAATSSEDLLFYPFMLRYLKKGWTLEARRAAFDALNRAEKLNGASTYFKAINDTRSELAAALTPEDAASLADVVRPVRPAQLSPHALPTHTFRVWKLEDLTPKISQVSKGRSFEGAKAALITAQCVFCHRVSSDPALPAGVFGPDLTQVSARFNRQDLLMHILEPSKFIDEKFRYVTVTKTDGAQVTGSLESEDDERLVLKSNPLATEVAEIGKSMIRERKVSDVSPMPAGLVNALKAEQIYDMLAYFEAQGDPRHPAFQK